jgi:hypothetical protein
MATSNLLAIQEMDAGQADRSVTFNEALATLEAFAGAIPCVEVSQDTPPVVPAEGNVYVVGTAPTGAWTAHARKVAIFKNGSWLYVAPREGLRAYNALGNSSHLFDGTDWILDSGGVSFANITETLTGTSTTKAVTPDGLAALWEKGADIASAGTITIGEGGYHHVTGTTTITDIDWTTPKDGRTAILVFDGILTLAHSANLVLPGAANIVTAAGDVLIVAQDAGDAVKVIGFQRSDGSNLYPLLSVLTGVVFTNSNPVLATDTLLVAIGKLQARIETHGFAASDETTALTTGTGKITLRPIPYSFAITGIRASLSTAQTSGSLLTVDVKVNGASVFSTMLTFDNAEKTTTTAATPAVLSSTSIPADAEITADITQVGDGTAKGLKIYIDGKHT